MSGLYKVDFFPRDWLTGTRELSPEARGVYWDLNALIYDRGGPLRYDEGDLRRMLGGLDVRPLRRIVGELVAKGKIEVAGGFITIKRALEEIAKAERRGAGTGKEGAGMAERDRAAKAPPGEMPIHGAPDAHAGDPVDSAADGGQPAANGSHGLSPNFSQTSRGSSGEVRGTSARSSAEVGPGIEPDQPLDLSARRALARASLPSPSPSLEREEGGELSAARARASPPPPDLQSPQAPQAETAGEPPDAVPRPALAAAAPTPAAEPSPQQLAEIAHENLDAFFETPGFLRRTRTGAAPTAAAGAPAVPARSAHDAELRAGLAEALGRRTRAG